MKYKIFATLFFVLFCLSYSIGEQKTIFYISDNIHFSDTFDTQYTNMLKDLLEDFYGKKTVSINKFSRFDINTTESFEIIHSTIKQNIPNAVILMIGEANYYNLYGFSSYISGNKIEIPYQKQKTVFDINKDMANIYGVKTKFLDNIINTAYKQIINTSQEYRPKVIPDFYALEDTFTTDGNLLAAIETYRYAWSLIKDNNFDKAREFIISMIKSKPSISMFYYALASTYLLEQKENYEFEALKWFENGILADPFNKDNLCYKGLILLFMSYKGEITTEILYFAKMLNYCSKNLSNEITTIVTINTSDYDKKTEAINGWILYDIERIKEFCNKNNIPLIYASYPEDSKVNKPIETYINDTKDIFYINNVSNNKQEETDLLIRRLAKNMSKFLINNKILN